MKKTIIVAIILLSLLIPRTTILASPVDVEMEILRIKIRILELQIQHLLAMIQEIQLKKGMVVEDNSEIVPEIEVPITMPEIPGPQQRVQDCLLQYPNQPQYCDFSGCAQE